MLRKNKTLVIMVALLASSALAQVYDANGRLKVNAETGAVTVSDGAGALNVILDSGTLTSITNAVTVSATNLDVRDLAHTQDSIKVGDGVSFIDIDVAAGDNESGASKRLLHTEAWSYVFDGTNWDRLRGDETNGALVNLGTNNDVTVTSGNITVSDGAGALNTILDSGTLTSITNSVTVTDGSGAMNVIVDSGTTTVTATNLDVQIGGSDSLTIGTFPDNEPVNMAQKGGTAIVALPCERETHLYVQINQATGTQLISGTASERIYICSISLVTATAQNIALVDGTGSVCATSPTGLLGGSTAATGQNFAANGGWVLPYNPGAWAKTSTDADNVCLLQSSTGQVSGILTYISIPNI